jgi:hypothetical protein
MCNRESSEGDAGEDDMNGWRQLCHDQATQLCRHRVEARIVDAYVTSVEQWIATGVSPAGPLRMR